MSSESQRWLIALLLAGGVGCRVPPPGPAAAVPPGRVVLLVVDGARVDELLGDAVSSVSGMTGAELAPNIHAELIPAGTLYGQAISEDVTITTEAHATLFAGRRLPLGTFPPSSGDTYAPDVPTLFEMVRREYDLSQGQVSLVVNTVLLSDLQTSLAPGFGADFAPTYDFNTDDQGRDLSDPTIVARVKARLADNDTYLVAANLHQIDLAGHTGPDGAYPARMTAVDGPLTALWHWIEATPPYAGTTTLVVVADHGRHRTGEDDDWRAHGDACSGCRDVPLLVLGPGATAGAVVDTPVTLADVAATMAARLGVELPLGTGVDLGTGTRPVGEVGIAAGEVVATQRWTSDPSTRNEVLIEGAVVSTTGALFAEHPVAKGDVVCWRELLLGEDQYDTEPWLARCLRSGVDLGAPVATVSGLFVPSLAIDLQDRPWMAWSDNPNGYTGSSGVSVRVARFDEQWDEPSAAGLELVHPGPPSLLLLSDDRVLVAVASSDSVEEGRDTRRIDVLELDWGPAPVWSQLARLDLGDGLVAMERPALHDDGDSLALAFMGFSPSPVVMLSTSTSGTDWTAPVALDADRVLPHLTPAWTDNGRLLWAALSAEGTVALRQWDGSQVTSWDSGADSVDGLAADAALASLRIDGVWQTVDIGL
jgi:Metalloenzyme superfamily